MSSHCSKLDIFEEDSASQEFIQFATIRENKINSEIDIAVSSNFRSDLWKKFATRFKDIAEIEKLRFSKSSFVVSPVTAWTDVATKLFRLSKHLLQMEILDLQEDISLYSLKNVGVNISQKNMNIANNYPFILLLCWVPHIIVKHHFQKLFFWSITIAHREDCSRENVASKTRLKTPNAISRSDF